MSSIANKCAVEDCNKQIVTRGYCGGHYQKFRKQGLLKLHTQVIAERGKMTDHEFYQRWSKMKNLGELCERWQDFWLYVDDIGDPNGCTKMHKLRANELYGPDNFRWAEELIGDIKNRYYQRIYRTKPQYRDQKYKYQYGITLNQYEELFRKQNGRCAICNEEEKRAVRNGLPERRKLSLDHCHTTEKVRGLLCSDCNPSLGGFKDSVKILEQAIAYLKKHQTT